MRPVDPGLTQMIPTSLSARRPLWPESPGLPCTISRWQSRKTSSFCVVVSTRSTQSTPFTEAGKWSSSSGETGFLWGENGSRPPCGKWASKGSIRGPISVNGPFNTGSTRTFSGTWFPTLRIMYGASISPTSDYRRAGCTLWRPLTGIPAMSSPGSLTIPWRCLLSSTAWIGPWSSPFPASGTVIREATSPVPAIWSVSRLETFKSAWMEKAGLSTISSPNVSGEASNTKRSISTNMPHLEKPENESLPGSSSIIRKDLTSPWTTGLLGRFSTSKSSWKRETKTSLPKDSLYSKFVLKKGTNFVLTSGSTIVSEEEGGTISLLLTISLSTMRTHRKHYLPEFKSKVVLELLREEKTLFQLASEHGIHHSLLVRWRSQVRGNRVPTRGLYEARAG